VQSKGKAGCVKIVLLLAIGMILFAIIHGHLFRVH
jgi:hypothetical protein